MTNTEERELTYSAYNALSHAILYLDEREYNNARLGMADALAALSALSDHAAQAPQLAEQVMPEQVREALQIAEKTIDILWVSHHANRADQALEKIRALLAAAPSQPGDVGAGLWRGRGINE
jgi:hypothetical protein